MNIFILVILSVHATLLDIYSAHTFLGCDTCSDRLQPGEYWKALGHLLLLFVSVPFFVFSIAILTDQFRSISSDTTLIETLAKKGPFRPNMPKKVFYREVCGNNFPLFWVFPCSTLPKDSLKNHDSRHVPPRVTSPDGSVH